MLRGRESRKSCAPAVSRQRETEGLGCAINDLERAARVAKHGGSGHQVIGEEQVNAFARLNGRHWTARTGFPNHNLTGVDTVSPIR